MVQANEKNFDNSNQLLPVLNAAQRHDYGWINAIQESQSNEKKKKSRVFTWLEKLAGVLHKYQKVLQPGWSAQLAFFLTDAALWSTCKLPTQHFEKKS